MIAALLHNGTNPTAVFKDLDFIAEANTRGHRLTGQVSCCPLTMDFTLVSPCPVEGLQSWKPALGLQGDAFEAVLKGKAFGQSVRDEIAAPTSFWLLRANETRSRRMYAGNKRQAGTTYRGRYCQSPRL